MGTKKDERRILAVGDLHGALESLIRIARDLGLIAANLSWIAEKTDFVQLGDVCDRGPHSRGIFELLMRWQEEAPKLGSRLIFLPGNHEIMTIAHHWYYATSGEVEEYAERGIPSGTEGRRVAFSPGGRMFEWLKRQSFIVRLGRLIFAHGDMPIAFSDLRLSDIDDQYRRALDQIDGPEHIPACMIDSSRSILWCREAQIDRSADYESHLVRFLAHNEASVYVCGHTPSENKRFRQLCDSHYLCIDTAIFHPFVGVPSALEVCGSSAFAWYWEDEETLRLPLSLPL